MAKKQANSVLNFKQFKQVEGIHCFSCGTFLLNDTAERKCPCGGALVLDAIDVPNAKEGF